MGPAVDRRPVIGDSEHRADDRWPLGPSRRTPSASPDRTLWDAGWVRFRFGEFQLDDKRFTLSGPTGAVHVEPQVFELLHHLMSNHDRVVSKEELLDAIWGDRFVSESALTSRVKAARRAVGDDGQAQRVIKTIHARGYQFVAEVHLDAGRIRRALPRLRNAPIGRDADIACVVERIHDAPLVTVTGSGGSGRRPSPWRSPTACRPTTPTGSCSPISRRCHRRRT